jgi:hypothetical protein
VQRYAVQMRHSTFPPIVVTDDDYIIDGNTRIGAARANGRHDFPAIIVKAEGASKYPRRS